MATNLKRMNRDELSRLNTITYDGNLIDIYDLGIYQPVIEGMRNYSHGNSALLSIILAGWILDSGDLASAIAFRTDDRCTQNIKVMNDFTGDVEERPCHSVVLYGEIIVDALCSNRVFKTKDYIDRLEQLNGSIMVSTMGSWWIDRAYNVIVPTISFLKEL